MRREGAADLRRTPRVGTPTGQGPGTRLARRRGGRRAPAREDGLRAGSPGEVLEARRQQALVLALESKVRGS